MMLFIIEQQGGLEGKDKVATLYTLLAILQDMRAQEQRVSVACGEGVLLTKKLPGGCGEVHPSLKENDCQYKSYSP